MRDSNALFAKVCTRLALCFAVAAITKDATADDKNYQKYVIGERAMGMGGAQVASVNDPTAGYYNPGAMGFSSTSMISASKSLYSYDYRLIKDGFVARSDLTGVDAETLEHENDLTMPSTLALMFQFGPRLYDDGPRRHALGISVLVPYQDSFTLSAKWDSPGGLTDRETYSVTEEHRDIWTGISYGYRLSEQWGLGLSAFLSESRFKRGLDVNWFTDYGGADECGLSKCGFMEFRESRLEMSVIALIFRVGTLWDPHENWRFGLTATPPSITLGDLWFMGTKGSLDQTFGISNVEGSLEDYVEFYTDKYELDVTKREPMSLRGGAAFLWNDYLNLGLDVTVHLPVDYPRIKGDPVQDRVDAYNAEKQQFEEQGLEYTKPAPSPYWLDDGVVKKIEREPVVNLNLGCEWNFAQSWTLRSGLFTDFSSAPDVVRSDMPQLTKIHRFGASLSFGFRTEGYDITLGATGSYGRGDASVYQPVSSGGGVSEFQWVPREYEERAIYIFVAGAQKAVAQTAQTLWKKVWEDESKKKEGK